MRVGFIGCGRHATTSLYPALAPAGLELAATCANRLDGAEHAARRFGAERGYASVPAMLDHPGLDAVLVSVPPSAYVTVVPEVLAAGLPVFCEKPGGASVSDLAIIEQAARSAQQPVMVGYMKRFARAYQQAAQVARGPEFGRITSVHVKFLMGPGFGSLTGFVIDNTVHALDLLRFFGGEVVDLTASALSLDEDRHAVSLLVTFASGAVGTAQLGTTGSFLQENELLEVVGVEHSLSVTNVDTLAYRRPAGMVAVDRPTYTVPLPANMSGTVMGFVPELEHFRAVVTDGQACGSDIVSARTTLALAERVSALLTTS